MNFAADGGLGGAHRGAGIEFILPVGLSSSCGKHGLI